MLRALGIWFGCLLSIIGTAQAISVGSAVDPYIITEFSGQPSGNQNITGLTQQASTISVPGTTAVIVTHGQSLIASNSLGTFSTVNAAAHQFNIYDGAIYNCANPVLGASSAINLGSNGPNCQIADSLITNAVFTRVIMVPIAIDGTLAADWNGVTLSGRITATWRRLASLGLVPKYILWHQGEQDAGAGTAGAAYTASVQAVATQWRTLGYTGPFFVAKETMVSNATNATIRTAQTNATSAPLHIVAGADWDTLTTATNRQGDGTHLTQAGAAAAAALDVTVVTNCKNTSC